MTTRPEIWLRANRRVILASMAIPVVMGAVGLLLALGWLGISATWIRWGGGGLATVAGIMFGFQCSQLLEPRVAFQDGDLLIHVRPGGPVRVPIAVVECFFLGQGASHLPGQRNVERQTTNVVIRLAERATEWSQVQVNPFLASWCGGYVTLRGAWCEPLSLDVVNRLNRRLGEVRLEGRGESGEARGTDRDSIVG